MVNGPVGPRSSFGEMFFAHYGETRTTAPKLYNREQTYFHRHGYTSWDENGKDRPKWQRNEEYCKRIAQYTKERWENGTFFGTTGMKLTHKTHNKKEQKTMTIKDYANQLKNQI